MAIRRHVANAANRVLCRFGAKIVACPKDERPWDQEFAAWMTEARISGRDPNDIGDARWANDPIKLALQQYYLPYIQSTSVVLELGPGTGRLTRHVIGRCAEMVLADYSRLACNWLEEYLAGRGRFKTMLIDKPQLGGVAEGHVDAVIAHGVFEHLDLDETCDFLTEFHRVLKVNGHACFNFDNAATDEAFVFFRRFRGGDGSKCPFKLHHPDTIRRLGQDIGFQVLDIATSASRFAYAVLRKGEQHQPWA